MELILEFVVGPILNAAIAVAQFVFWTMCWVVLQPVRGVVWLARKLGFN